MSGWSRFLGVSLRPFTGHAPHSLLLRGAIQVGLCIFFFVVGVRLATGDELAGHATELAYMRRTLFLAGIAVTAVALMGATQLVIGLLDLVPRRQVTGVVLSVRRRRFLDFLPRFAERMLYDRRGDGAIDRRKERTEVVLRTPEGDRQWTLRSHRTRRELRVGEHVRLTVSPIAGYVASVEPLGR
ncbi:MAG: hypothetical protein GX596_03860 [Propionibacterium sp.]|nr:hypothetical protein [Propionibacterium sp.]